MKQPKRLCRSYKEAVSAYNLNAEDYMLLKDGDTYITIIHKRKNETILIDKYAREVIWSGKKGGKL